ncbi:MAG: MBL fold metallo-hydrolase [bacterium]|nr:MBL fold metallo-hydrolase [bacterium]
MTTCVAIIDNGRAWLLDAGPDFPRHLAVLDAAGVELAGVLLTHGHMGHYTGLMFLGREAMDTAAIPVWAAPRLAAFLAGNGPWEQLVNSGNIDLCVLDPQEQIPLGERGSAMGFLVPHRDEYSETLGFVVTGPTGSLVYVPDTDSWDGWDPPVEAYVAQADIALLDATFFDHTELPGRNIAEIAHPLVVDSMARFAQLSDEARSKIHFTHLNHSNPLLDTGSDEYIRVARSGMHVASEGDIFDL